MENIFYFYLKNIAVIVASWVNLISFGPEIWLKARSIFFGRFPVVNNFYKIKTIIHSVQINL